MRIPLLSRLLNRSVTANRSNLYIEAGHGSYGPLTHGGFQNPATGAGIPGLDRTESAFWTPSWYWSRQTLQTLYVQSWAAAHFINIPIDDMFIRWRQWDSGSDADMMTEQEQRYELTDKLARTLKAARLYGTGLLIVVSRDGPMDMEMSPEQIRTDDVSHLLVFDRFSASVREWDNDPLSPTYGEALTYDIFPSSGQNFSVHHSRVIRFDGIRPLGDDGFTIYDRQWGVSAIVPVIIALIQDQSGASAAGHLMQMASMDVVKMMGFRDALAGQQEKDDPSPEALGERMNELKSVYRTVFMDASDEFERQAVSFAGLPEMLDRMARRLAASAQIPATRFWGQSPVGMNATGESDMVNYAESVMAMQERMLSAPLRRLDTLLARSAGLASAPEYTWLPLTDLSEAERVQNLKTRVEALNVAINAGIIDEDEARQSLDGDEFLGDLPGMAPGLPEVDMGMLTTPMPDSDEV